MLPASHDEPFRLSSRPRRHCPDLVDCGIIVLDCTGRITLWNRRMVTHAGRAAARMRWNGLFAVFPELRGGRMEAAVLAALADGASKQATSLDSRTPFPLPPAGNFDGARIEQAVSVTAVRDDVAARYGGRSSRRSCRIPMRPRRCAMRTRSVSTWPGWAWRMRRRRSSPM